MTPVLIIVLIALPTCAGVLISRREEDAQPQGHGALTRLITYWLFTIVITFELAAGGVWDLLRIEYVRVVLAHLGYPLYLLIILGVWRIPGALVLLAPRLPRLKEWAYAGAIFNYTGAAASHFLAGDGPNRWMGPSLLSVFTLISWTLRPRSRRLLTSPASEIPLAPWAVAVGIVAAMLVVASFTLPKGAPPQ